VNLSLIRCHTFRGGLSEQEFPFPSQLSATGRARRNCQSPSRQSINGEAAGITDGRIHNDGFALVFSILIAVTIALLAVPVHSAEKFQTLRAAYPAIAPGSTPSWVTAEKGIWRKCRLDVEPILVSDGARAVPALIGQSVQFLFGSDTSVTTAQLQGIPVVRLGVTMNTLGSSLITHHSVQSVRDLKGKTLGISRGRDASYIRLAKLLRDHGLNPNDDVKFLSIGGGEGVRLSALKAGLIQGTMLFPPLDRIARNEGLKVLEKFDVATPGGGINTTATLLKQNRKLVINFLKGYMEGIHFMIHQ
jgi:ABC-type nitrate/sulfonate/bicarbonate transport system substrate-binding protein